MFFACTLIPRSGQEAIMRRQILACALACATLTMAFGMTAFGEEWSNNNGGLTPGAIYDHSGNRRGASMGGKDFGFVDPGGVATFVFSDVTGSKASQLSMKRGTLQIGNSSHPGGDTLVLRGEDPSLMLTNATLRMDAGSLDRDKAVLSMVDTAFIEKHGGQNKFILVGSTVGPSQIDLVNGKIIFTEEVPNPDPELDWSQVEIMNLTMNIGDRGLLDASNVGAIYIDSSHARGTTIYSNGGMAAKSIVVARGAKLHEQKKILIDGIGGTTTTRDFFRLAYDGEYFGDIAVESHVTLPEGTHDMIIHSGILHGDLDIRAGSVLFPEGCIEGAITISGGTVETWDANPGTPPYVANGIYMTGGSLVMPDSTLESGGDIGITNGATAQIGTLANFAGTLSVGSQNDANGGSALSVGVLDMQPGSMLLADPPWGLAPANVAVESPGAEAGDSILRGSLGVGMNALVAIGTRDLTWLPQKVAEATSGAGLSRDGLRNALGLYRPVTLAEGSALHVDGSLNNEELAAVLATPANTATFAGQSALILNGADEQLQSGMAALAFESPAGSVHVQDGARLFITDAKAGSTYRVVDAAPIIYHDAQGNVVARNETTAWDGDNLRASSGMLGLTFVHEEKTQEPDTPEPGTPDPITPETPEATPDVPATPDPSPVQPGDTGPSPSRPDTPDSAPSQPGTPENSGDSDDTLSGPANPPAPDDGNTEEPGSGNASPDNDDIEGGQAPDDTAGDAATDAEPDSDEADEGDSNVDGDVDRTPANDRENDRIEVTIRDAREVYPALSSSVAGAVTGLYARGLNDVNSPIAGIRFLSRATDVRFVGDGDLAASVIESAARMAIVGAVPQMTLAANAAGEAAMQNRTGILALQGADPENVAVQKFSHSVALWVMPIYGNSSGFGLEAGNFSLDFNGTFGGLALGADYTFADNFRAGVAFNIGGGYASSSGDLRATSNDMDFWGIGAYAGWSNGVFGLSGDVSYTSTYNKLEQDMLPQMYMGDLKSDITAQALSAALIAEWRLPLESMDIVAHAGARFTTMRVDSHDIKSGGVLAEVDSFTQNIWTFPAGISFSRQFETESGWRIRPSLDLSVIPATGDIKAKSRARFSGLDNEMYLESQTRDNITYGGSVGVEFSHGNFSLGVAYDGQFGAHTTSQGVFGILKYEF